MATNDRMFTLAEMREAFAKGAAKWGAYDDHATDEARKAYPDPEPAWRWVTLSSDIRAALCDNGTVTGRKTGDPDDEVEVIVQTADDICDLYSLLPRVPVEVTDGMVDLLRSTFLADMSADSWRAALEAVAADLAQSVATCQHKATRWVVVDKDGQGDGFHDREIAEATTRRWDIEYASLAPHRVVALAEVDE